MTLHFQAIKILCVFEMKMIKILSIKIINNKISELIYNL